MTVTIDGVTYTATTEVEGDPHAHSLSFSHRGIELESRYTTVITGDNGSIVRFDLPSDSVQNRNWWLPSTSVTEETIARAVAFAKPGVEITLQGDQVPRVVWGDAVDLTSLAIGLPAIAKALVELTVAYTPEARERLTMALLAAGCTAPDTDDARLAIADWIASHADALHAARPVLQQMLDQDHGTGMAVVRCRYPVRSAIAFLLDWCNRVNVELALETVDAQLEGAPAVDVQPAGVPWSHWWCGKARRPTPMTTTTTD